MSDKKGNWIEINVEELHKAPWNYKVENDALLDKLENNIKRTGNIVNLIVRELATGGYEVVNGNHRVTVLKRLGQENVMCYNLGAIELSEAVRVAIETNETRFESDRLRLALTISEIAEEFGEMVEDTLPYDKSTIEEFTSIANFDFEVYSKPSNEDAIDIHAFVGMLGLSKMGEHDVGLIERKIQAVMAGMEPGQNPLDIIAGGWLNG